MTRRGSQIAAVLAACAAVLGATEVAGARRERPPARLLVSADEHRLLLSRQSIVSGLAVVQFQNRGEDPHDLRVRRTPRAGVTARRVFSVAETPSGDLKEVEWRLPSGRYRLWCSLPGHEQAGMRAKLRVKRSR